MSQPWKPHPYQSKAVRFGVERMTAGFFLDPGLGKTGISYAILKVLRKAGMAERMLVIAPLRPAQSTWPREAQKWTDFKELNVHVLHGAHKQQLLEQPHDVSVINPEGLAWLLGGEEQQPVLDKAGKPVIDPRTGGPKTRTVQVPGAAQKAGVWWDILVVDESTRFKHATTERFKVLRPHLPKFNRRYILTGSPAPNGMMDLFGQVYLLDLGRSLGRYISHYRNAFFDQGGYGGYTYTLQDGAEERIYKLLKPLVLRMSAEDYLDLPPLINNVVDVTLPPKAMRVYKQMETLLMTQLDGNLVTAANVGAATMKCRQIANGGIYLDEGGKTDHVHDVKTEAVMELLEELSGKPALIAYEFRHDLERLGKALDKAYKGQWAYIGGGVSGKAARTIEDRWNAGGLRALLAQPASVAHGLNLQGTSAAVIFHSNIWNLEEDEQLVRRVWRQGQKERVVVHRIRALGTVDEAIMLGLGRKDRTQKALLAALREVIKGKGPRGR